MSTHENEMITGDINNINKHKRTNTSKHTHTPTQYTPTYTHTHTPTHLPTHIHTPTHLPTHTRARALTTHENTCKFIKTRAYKHRHELRQTHSVPPTKTRKNIWRHAHK